MDVLKDGAELGQVATLRVLALDHPQYIGSRFDAAKPPYSYSCLIAEAILNSPEQRLPLASIYSAIQKAHPYYQSKNLAWQNSIRHNLSLNKCFERVEKGEGERRKGSYWMVRGEMMEVVVQEGGSGRVQPKQGTQIRKKKGSAGKSEESNPTGQADNLIHAPINGLQIEYALDGLCFELYEDEDAERGNLAQLCSVLQDIHSNHSTHHFDYLL